MPVEGVRVCPTSTEPSESALCLFVDPETLEERAPWRTSSQVQTRGNCARVVIHGDTKGSYLIIDIKIYKICSREGVRKDMPSAVQIRQGMSDAHPWSQVAGAFVPLGYMVPVLDSRVRPVYILRRNSGALA